MFCLFLYVLWILLNGRVTWEILLIGAPVSALVYWFTLKFTGLTFRRDLFLFRKLPSFFAYLLFLWKETLLSALRVMKLIWFSPRPDSGIVDFVPDLSSVSCRMLWANSITLTPGTITVEADANQFRVHFLQSSPKNDLPTSAMHQKIRKLESGS